MQLDALAFLPHPTDITDIAPPPPRPFASVRFDPLAWSSGSDQRRISGCGIRWLLAGPDSLPLWLCRVCAFVLLRCFSCSHTVLPKEHSLGIIFFSSLSSCKCCIFLQFYLHFTTDYTCMIVYVTNNKEPEPEPEPWTWNWGSSNQRISFLRVWESFSNSKCFFSFVFTEERTASCHTSIKHRLVECCSDVCPSVGFSYLHIW